MCFLKVHSDTHSFKKFCETTKIPVYSVFDKDEFRNKSKTRKSKTFVISFDVSDADWGDFPAQVTDAIKFLTDNFSELEMLIAEVPDADGYLDFPLYSRLDDEVINQNDHLPKALVSLAGKLNLGIEMAIYSHEALE